ncbi:hypothetical protein GCM10023066_27190 [Nocardioides kongjuensis]
MTEKTPDLYKTTATCTLDSPVDEPCATDRPMWDEWHSRMKALDFASPLDEKARDTTLAHFDGNSPSIAATTSRLGVDHKTVTRRLERAQRNGWVVFGASPLKAGRITLPRVCLRRIFWTDDYWNAVPQWNGDTASPVF